MTGSIKIEPVIRKGFSKMGQLQNSLVGFLTQIQTLLIALGAGVCVIGIVVGGLMRATAFGSERRIAASNVALSCAVVGFIIVLLASTVSSGIKAMF